MEFTVRGRVLPSWGGNSKAVRVNNEEEFLAWVEEEGVTTQIFYESDEDGEKRPSVYLGDKMAGQVDDGDLVELRMETQDTKKGRNFRLLVIHRVD